MAETFVNPRWIDIPEERIITVLSGLNLKTWHVKILDADNNPRYYLHSAEGYGYPYSLPLPVAQRLANALNERHSMTWYKKYNSQAIEYFEANGQGLNQAAQYWDEQPDKSLPKPTITPLSELGIGTPAPGSWYIAIIGLFHLTGSENGGNHHLFIDLLDEAGNRIYDHTPPLHLYYEWEGMRPDEQPPPVRIDKPDNEPGANIGLHWGQVLRGFHINNVAVDQFSGVHVRYGADEAGNHDGHHSHFLALQKRQWVDDIPPPDPDPPEPEPEPEPEPQRAVMSIDIDWFNSLPEVDGQKILYVGGDDHDRNE